MSIQSSISLSATRPAVPPPHIRGGEATCYHSVLETARGFRIRHNTLIARGEGQPPIKVYGQDHDDARAKRNERLKDYSSGRDTITRRGRRENPTVGELAIEVLKLEVEPRYDRNGNHVGGLEPNTWTTYSKTTRLYLQPMAIARLAARDVGRADVLAYHQEMIRRGFSSSNMQFGHRRLSAVLQYALRNSEQTGVTRNWAREVPVPRHRRKKVPKPDLGVLQRILQAAAVTDASRETDYEEMIQVMLSLGVRKEELLGLQWGDLNLKERYVTLRRRIITTNVPGKAAQQVLEMPGMKLDDTREDTVPLSEYTIGRLKIHRARLAERYMRKRRSWTGVSPLEPQAWVFPSHTGEVQNPRTYTNWYHKMSRRLGIEHSPHKLRHAFASLLVINGVPMVQVQHLLRHSKIATTSEHYVHLVPEVQHVAMGVMGGIMEELTG